MKVMPTVLKIREKNMAHQIFNIGGDGPNYQIKEMARIVYEFTLSAKLKLVKHEEDERT